MTEDPPIEIAIEMPEPLTVQVELTPPLQVHVQMPIVVGMSVGIEFGPPGKSAYQLAVEQGFVGTEDEFLGIQRRPAAVVLSSSCFVSVNSDGSLIRADSTLGIFAMGFVRQSAAPGDLCIMEQLGAINGFVGLTPGPVYLGSAGQPTQVVPQAGIHQEVATAVSAVGIFVQITSPIYLI